MTKVDRGGAGEPQEAAGPGTLKWADYEERKID